MNDLESKGYAIVAHVLAPETIAALIALVEERTTQESHRGGVRNLLDIAEFRALANSAAVVSLAEEALGKGAFPVRGILFDKTDAANWKVPWHQDVTIAVTARVDAEGYGPWSLKAGVLHVQPPAKILERMVSIRLHLDDCPAENGALRVLPGTHTTGKLNVPQVDAAVAKIEPVTCAVGPGDALVMRPLLVHASSSSTVAKHRRVLHFDYSVASLPDGMDWAERR